MEESDNDKIYIKRWYQSVRIYERDKLESFDKKDFLTVQFFLNIINLLEESFKNIIY